MSFNEIPAYGVSEAARYLRLAPATLRSWVRGRAYPRGTGKAFFRPLIRLPEPDNGQLSFENLIEAHVLWGLRNRHNVPLKHVRIALKYAQRELGIERLLLHGDLRTSAGNVFLFKYGELLNLSKSGQMALRGLLEAHLKRVEWDDSMLPVRLYPFTGDPSADGRRVIVIDPAVRFGRPIVQRVGVSTAVIADRIDAGEELDAIAQDYEITIEELQAAVLFEKAA